jgi:hypothetical protein
MEGCAITYVVILELKNFLKTLDDRIEEKKKESKRYSAERIKRVEGSLLHSNPPKNIAAWCVDKDWRKGMHFYCI